MTIGPRTINSSRKNKRKDNEKYNNEENKMDLSKLLDFIFIDYKKIIHTNLEGSM